MRDNVRLLVVTTLSALALTLQSGSVLAASFRVEPQGNIAMSSVGKVTFFSGGGIETECELTLNGTVSSALLPKVAGTTWGSVTAARVNEAGCEEGAIESSDFLGLPWSIKYNSILGTLPEGVWGLLFAIEGWAVNMRAYSLFVNCLYRGAPGFSVDTSGGNPYETRGAGSLRTAMPRFRGTFLCPEAMGLSGLWNMTRLRITRL
jgi:hypothetical protein